MLLSFLFDLANVLGIWLETQSQCILFRNCVVSSKLQFRLLVFVVYRTYCVGVELNRTESEMEWKKWQEGQSGMFRIPLFLSLEQYVISFLPSSYMLGIAISLVCNIICACIEKDTVNPRKKLLRKRNRFVVVHPYHYSHPLSFFCRSFPILYV